jgi:hypothetical protein
MAYIGQTPTAVPLVAGDISDDAIDSQHYAAGSIDTAHLADDQITLAKMAAGTDGNIISYDASGNPVAIATGSDGQVLTSTGAGSPPAFEALPAAGFTLSTEQATGSGTAVTFGSIPTGTKVIHIMFAGVSNSTDDDFKVTIGDAGGLETSAYVSTTMLSQTNNDDVPYTNTTAFLLNGRVSASKNNGVVSLFLEDEANFTWVCTHTFMKDAMVFYGAGFKSLSAELTQVSVSVISGAFDLGAINIMYS